MERALLRFDRVFCLSQWHKDFFCSTYPTLHPERVIVTRNGIDPRRFEAFDAAAPRTNRLIWSSSPNRGLDLALGNFPYIRAQVPDAELHIYYGFDTWEKFAQLRGDPAEIKEIQRYRDKIAATPGAVYHGRINQRELAEAFLSSKVWYYPTGFTETSCVSAMEAQAGGAYPVTSSLAALAETLKFGTLIDPSDPAYGQKHVDATIAAMRTFDEPLARVARQAMHDYAVTKLTWSALAEEWSKMFDRIAQNVAVNPVSAWKAVS